MNDKEYKNRQEKRRIIEWITTMKSPYLLLPMCKENRQLIKDITRALELLNGIRVEYEIGGK